MQAQKEAAEKARKQAIADHYRDSVEQGQRDQIALAGQAGDKEVSALQNLINVFQRAAR
jgi:hypothetical protein